MRKNLDPFNNFEDADLWRALEEVEEFHFSLLVDFTLLIMTLLCPKAPVEEESQ